MSADEISRRKSGAAFLSLRYTDGKSDELLAEDRSNPPADALSTNPPGEATDLYATLCEGAALDRLIAGFWGGVAVVDRLSRGFGGWSGVTVIAFFGGFGRGRGDTQPTFIGVYRLAQKFDLRERGNLVGLNSRAKLFSGKSGVTLDTAAVVALKYNGAGRCRSLGRCGG